MTNSRKLLCYPGQTNTQAEHTRTANVISLIDSAKAILIHIPSGQKPAVNAMDSQLQ
jgi:hypothetical protein